METYGSNAGLAHARAEWVRSLLLDLAAPELDPARVVTLTSGPQTLGLDAPPGILANDRCVRIYACWAVRSTAP
jgi:hypothetical protein